MCTRLSRPKPVARDDVDLAVDNRSGLSNTRIIPRVLAALGWGMLAAASLVIGAFLGLARGSGSQAPSARCWGSAPVP